MHAGKDYNNVCVCLEGFNGLFGRRHRRGRANLFQVGWYPVLHVSHMRQVFEYSERPRSRAVSCVEGVEDTRGVRAGRVDEKVVPTGVRLCPLCQVVHLAVDADPQILQGIGRAIVSGAVPGAQPCPIYAARPPAFQRDAPGDVPKPKPTGAGGGA